MSGIITWFFIGAFLYYALTGMVKKGWPLAIRLWPFNPVKTKKVLYRMFVGFLIYLTFAAFLSAFLKLFHIDV